MCLNCLYITSNKSSYICKRNMISLQWNNIFLLNFTILSLSLISLKKTPLKTYNLIIYSTIFIWLIFCFITWARVIVSWLYNWSCSCYLIKLLLSKTICEPTDFKENWKFYKFFLVKSTSQLAKVVQFLNTSNFADLQVLAIVEFSFNALPR